MANEQQPLEHEPKRYRNLKSPEERRQFFENAFGDKLLEESTVSTEDGSEKTFSVYELEVDAGNPTLRKNALKAFLLDAAEAGYKQVFSPVAITTSKYIVEGDKKQPITEIYFTLEKPASSSPTTTKTE